MADLISQYEIKDIIMFVLILSLAIKGFITFIDWAKERGKKFFEKEQRVDNIEQNQSEQIAEIVKKQNEMTTSLSEIQNAIALLIASDRDDIKAYITSQYHHFVEDKKWIDDFSLECIEKRYGHYVEEGGNSFVESMMKQIRSLPRSKSES